MAGNSFYVQTLKDFESFRVIKFNKSLTCSSFDLKHILLRYQGTNILRRKEMTKFVRAFMFVFVVMSWVLAVCAPATTQAPEPTEVPPTTAPATVAPTEAPTEAPVEDPMAMYAPDAVSGDIIAAGSSTVFPLA